MAEAKKKKRNPGEFGEVLIHKFLQSRSFYDYALEFCRVSTNVGREDALTEVQEMYPEIKVKKKKLEWDPYACDRANKEFVRLVKEDRVRVNKATETTIGTTVGRRPERAKYRPQPGIGQTTERHTSRVCV